VYPKELSQGSGAFKKVPIDYLEGIKTAWKSPVLIKRMN
jgi:hypothetical protein